MTIITRFAPSPTGSLHIGGARTALFNWLYAKKNNGLFKLRIEDTDRLRSTEQAKDEILKSLKWLSLNWDKDIVYQHKQIDNHINIVKDLLNKGFAYKCFCTKETLQEIREEAKKNSLPPKYDRRCRNINANNQNSSYVVRLKTPLEGQTRLIDKVLGEIIVDNSTLDDFIILRSDHTPTYMLSVVVDDYEMKVTDVIRGDDHLTNTFKQIQIYNLLQWDKPNFSHIPLIHGEDGSKLSKRHGAESILTYKSLGYLPEAMNNYLLRLGWGHGDEDIISVTKALDLFDIDGIGKSAARFDILKLDSLNSNYIKNKDDRFLIDFILDYHNKNKNNLLLDARKRLVIGIEGIKERSKTMLDLVDFSNYYVLNKDISIEDSADIIIKNTDKNILLSISKELSECSNWTANNIEEILRTFAKNNNFKLGKIASPIRAAVTGKTISPSIFKVLEIIGKNDTLKRIDKAFL